MMEKDWAGLTPEERRRKRLDRWLNPEDAGFISNDAESAYRERAQRLIDAWNVEEPDRVPVIAAVGAIPAATYGVDFHTAIYDYDKMAEVWTRFNDEYSRELDSFAIPAMVTPARAYDLLDLRLYAYPGHGLPTSATGVQFVEGEYMMADEYDALIRDPSDFWIRVFMPRIFGALRPFRALAPFTDIVEQPAMKLLPFTRPDVQASLQALIDAGRELAKWSEKVLTFMRLATASGFPSATTGAFCKAPFDTLGDTLRGTKGIMMDMYRRPEKLLEAMDVMADLSIESALSSLNATGGFRAVFPLHKGADGWMSDAQFDTFYWPPLRKVVAALIEEGISILLFAEGSFDTRLDKVNEFPKGAVSWLFDKTDMARAKRMLGDRCCIMGNVPASLMVTGEPGDIKAYCRKLIEDCGKGGGYVLSPGILGIDEAKLSNVKAMVDAAREFGTYTK
ncbi:MAG: uroporphyrinogen decarboxylase family protein [Syntrophorhabdales bacterium]|jgi:uroporphyrinogen-III decarboxylase